MGISRDARYVAYLAWPELEPEESRVWQTVRGAGAVATSITLGVILAAILLTLLPELLRWFYAASGRNEMNAQLWLSCHSASLLDDLNKEEIVICEKDREGRSRIYSLMDVKVRRDENHYRKYLSGEYGGVPSFG